MSIHSPRLSPLVRSFLLLTAIATAGCDPSDDGPADDDRIGLGSDAEPLYGQLELPLHPCGNAVIDPGEACDDGLANGPERECTQLCTFNDCELDEHGWCEDEILVAG